MKRLSEIILVLAIVGNLGFIDFTFAQEPCDPLQIPISKKFRHIVLKFVIEADSHFVGDDPWAEGIIWEKTFNLPHRINSKSTAFVTFCARNLEFTNLIVNDNFIGIPPFDPSKFFNFINTLPAAGFHPGENTIGFESLCWPDGNCDDFEFSNLVLYFQ